MAERSLSLSKVVRLSSGELSQAKVDPTPYVMIAIAGILLVGTAWWAAAGD
jgi:hypothetical protein